MKKFVIGDPHGGYKALLQCLERSGFDKEKDQLICLGDVADGWPQVPECVEELLTIKNLISIKGNHDDWAHQWLKFGIRNPMWLPQGGQATYDAYVDRHPDLMIKHEKEFFDKQHNYYIDNQNRGFVHGGYQNIAGLGHESNQSVYLWDRTLFDTALSGASNNGSLDNRLPIRLRSHKEIYIGHTSTVNWDYSKTIPPPEGYKKGDHVMTPINACNVWNMDTGGGFYGKLTIMDIDTKEYFQSDLLKELYPNELGR